MARGTMALAGAVLVLWVGVWLERDAQACGGCLSPPNEVTVVDSHRMVISLGLKETILWDQIRYSGDPEDFVWVLPVPSAFVSIELAEPAFFDVLDAFTAPAIQPASPPPVCPASGGGLGCAGGGDDGGPSFGGDAGGGGGGGVTVHSEETVGPYDTVVVGSEDPLELYQWLSANDYVVPSEYVGVFDDYIARDSVFVVLRLSPGQGVGAMQPVRIRYPGYMGTFPLEMVVVGAQGVLELMLFVVSEQRYEPRNYDATTIDEQQLAWDWATNRSDYAELFDATIQRSGGRSWITEFAGPMSGNRIAAQLMQDAPEDQTAATDGLVYPYVTRLRTRMRVDHIDADLQLAPAADPSDVSRQLFARIDVNVPRCDDASCRVGLGGRSSALLVLSALLISCAAFSRRRRR